MPINESHKNLARNIKKTIYAKSQSIKAIFPPGLGSVALTELNSILKNLWFPPKFMSEASLGSNDVRIDNIHMFSIMELLIRSQCVSDIRLIIYEGKVFGKEAFAKRCNELPWELYINKNMTVRVKVKSIASKAFHETALKEILNSIIQNYACIMDEDKEHATTTLYADFYKNRLTLSISLAGEPLYKRGYRDSLSASAPLREDIAACCINNTLEFAKKFENAFSPDAILIPFAGTGTIAFEYIQSYFKFSPALMGRSYAIMSMPLFNSENFHYLLKKAREHSIFLIKNTDMTTHVICIDNSKTAYEALQANILNFKNCVLQNSIAFPYTISSYCDDFFKLDKSKIISGSRALGNIFIGLNPPYGIRFNKNVNAVTLYKEIAQKINEISKIIHDEEKKLLGFILCPSEETWSSFCKNLTSGKTETYHITQGGIDIRVCQFLI